MISTFHQWFIKVWYQGSNWKYILKPLSWIFYVFISLRILLYEKGFMKIHRSNYPIIIVGNIAVGGTGKTPITMWLANHFIGMGYRPAVLTRGYKGKIGDIPIEVSKESNPEIVGDEAIMIASKLKCPVIAHPDRNLSLGYVSDKNIDFIISDDGLQHYQMDRDYEILIIDNERMYGNNLLLPAGPLREPISRLSRVNLILKNVECEDVENDNNRFRLVGKTAINLITGDSRLVVDFVSTKIHAVAGIGNPDRFFRSLRKSGLDIYEHPFEDHRKYKSSDLNFNDEHEIIMTEKDMVKCKRFANPRMWFIPVEVQFDQNEKPWLLDIERLIKDKKNG